MPIFEYYCPELDTVYAFYARSVVGGGHAIPLCPQGAHYRMCRIMSGFFVGRKQAEVAPGEPLGPLVEHRIQEIDRELMALDPDTSDPRRFAHCLRRAAETAGTGMDPALAEAVQRLERGESLDSVEDLLRASKADPAEAEHLVPPAESRGGTHPPFPAGPRHDPTLYELKAWLPHAPERATSTR